MKKVVFVLLLVIVQWWWSTPSIDLENHDLSFDYEVRYAGEGGRFDTLPMLVALHGNGDTPNNFYETTLNELSVPVRVVLLKGPIPQGMGSAWPWSPEDFERYGSAVDEAIVLLAQEYKTVGKPLLMGFSGGGMMAYYLAFAHGDHYAAIFPISGKLSDKLLGDVALSTGAAVYAFHGKSDSVVSLSGGQQAVEILRENGVEVELTSFEGGHQGIFSEMKPVITQQLEEKIREIY